MLITSVFDIEIFGHEVNFKKNIEMLPTWKLQYKIFYKDFTQSPEFSYLSFRLFKIFEFEKHPPRPSGTPPWEGGELFNIVFFILCNLNNKYTRHSGLASPPGWLDPESHPLE